MQVEEVRDAGARVIHVDVMSSHFVPPISTGALVVDAPRELVYGRDGVLDVPLMAERPERRVVDFRAGEARSSAARVVYSGVASSTSIPYGSRT